MQKKDFSISIILPTLNEEENLRFMVPDIAALLQNSCSNYEIIIVDDNSTDGTNVLVKKFYDKYNINFISRNGPKSLPLSIYEGIDKAQHEYVMWLDADGSVDTNSIKKLLEAQRNEQLSVFIGSRFIKGGGYKGQLKEQRTLKTTIKNIKNSEDSIIAIYLSVLFNKFLSLILRVGVKDLTSGFIIGRKNYFNKTMFNNFVYGEYFISLVSQLYIENIKIEEIPFVNKPRKFGKSKTSSQFLNMLKLAQPYIKQAILSKRQIT